MTEARRRTSFLLANLLLVGVSLVVSAAVGESLLRAATPSPIHWKYPQERYLYDPQIGVTLAPNQRGFTQDKPVEINSMGIRDREYSTTPPAGITRVVALGDSQTFGNGLAIADTWPKQLESALDDHFGRGLWEVLNCGVPGTDTWQHEVILNRMLHAYHPHLAILAFYVNDVTERYELKPQDAAAVTNTFRKRLAYLLKESVLFLAMREAIDSARQRFRPSRPFEMEQAVINGSWDPAVAKGWHEVDRSLVAMRAIADTRSVAFLVVVVPRRDQVSGRQPARNYQNRIREILERLRIRYVDALGPMQQAYAHHGRSMFIPWDGHNSAIANRVIAHELIDVVTAMHAARSVHSSHGHSPDIDHQGKSWHK